MSETVDILLATFNGARFLREQLESIEAQSYRNWRLIVRDDGSSDRTAVIIAEFARRHGDRVRVLRDGRPRLGACANFAALLAASQARYFMFCDQDDVWLPDKMSGLLQTMHAVENRRGAEAPILVHSDLIVVDGGLRLRHRSFWRHARLLAPGAQRPAARLILRNFVTGCAAMGNAPLRQAALPIPAEAYMHDWWLALVAALLGEVAAHEAPTVLYRQHEHNKFGAESRDLFAILRQFLRAPVAQIERVRFFIRQGQKHAAALDRSFGGKINAELSAILAELRQLSEQSLWRRKSFLFRHRLWPDSWVASALLWWFI